MTSLVNLIFKVMKVFLGYSNNSRSFYIYNMRNHSIIEFGNIIIYDYQDFVIYFLEEEITSFLETPKVVIVALAARIIKKGQCDAAFL